MANDLVARRVFLMALAALLWGCATQEQVQERVAQMEPSALEAARDRAQTDLACSAVKTQVIDRQVGELDRAYGLHRVLYRIEAGGCGRKSVYAVACTHNGVCSAMSDSGLVERQ